MSGEGGTKLRRRRAFGRVNRARTRTEAGRHLEEAEREKGSWRPQATREFEKKRGLLRRICREGTPKMFRDFLAKLTGDDPNGAEAMELLASLPFNERLRLIIHPESGVDSVLPMRAWAREPMEGSEVLTRYQRESAETFGKLY